MRPLELALGAVVVIAALLRRRPVGRLPSGVDAEDLVAGYERSDWHLSWVVVGGLGLLVVLGLVLLVVTWFEASSTELPLTVGRPTDLVGRLEGAPTPPPPRLEVDEGADLAIPIDRAKALLVERGVP